MKFWQQSLKINLINKTAEYDIVVPSDYMIDQMTYEDLIYKLDYSKLSNYNEDLFVPELKAIMKSENTQSMAGYYMPYFWGSLGIMYNKKRAGVEEAVLEHGWKVLFEHDLLPEDTKVGMYSVSRDALAAAELYLGYSLNTTNIDEINQCMDLLRNTDYDAWGTDDLKIKVSRGNIDVALLYSGDFFDTLYSVYEESDEPHISFDMIAPMNNNVFFDAMVIPNNSMNEELAYKFIDFMISHENSLRNAQYVGYCPTQSAVYNSMLEDPDFEGITDLTVYYPGNITNGEIYKYLGTKTYEVYDLIYKKVKK